MPSSTVGIGIRQRSSLRTSTSTSTSTGNNVATGASISRCRSRSRSRSRAAIDTSVCQVDGAATAPQAPPQAVPVVPVAADAALAHDDITIGNPSGSGRGTHRSVSMMVWSADSSISNNNNNSNSKASTLPGRLLEYLVGALFVLSFYPVLLLLPGGLLYDIVDQELSALGAYVVGLMDSEYKLLFWVVERVSSFFDLQSKLAAVAVDTAKQLTSNLVLLLVDLLLPYTVFGVVCTALSLLIATYSPKALFCVLFTTYWFNFAQSVHSFSELAFVNGQNMLSQAIRDHVHTEISFPVFHAIINAVAVLVLSILVVLVCNLTTSDLKVAFATLSAGARATLHNWELYLVLIPCQTVYSFYFIAVSALEYMIEIKFSVINPSLVYFSLDSVARIAGRRDLGIPEFVTMVLTKIWIGWQLQYRTIMILAYVSLQLMWARATINALLEATAVRSVGLWHFRDSQHAAHGFMRYLSVLIAFKDVATNFCAVAFAAASFLILKDLVRRFRTFVEAVTTPLLVIPSIGFFLRTVIIKFLCGVVQEGVQSYLNFTHVFIGLFCDSFVGASSKAIKFLKSNPKAIIISGSTRRSFSLLSAGAAGVMVLANGFLRCIVNGEVVWQWTEVIGILMATHIVYSLMEVGSIASNTVLVATMLDMASAKLTVDDDSDDKRAAARAPTLAAALDANDGTGTTAAALGKPVVKTSRFWRFWPFLCYSYILLGVAQLLLPLGGPLYKLVFGDDSQPCGHCNRFMWIPIWLQGSAAPKMLSRMVSSDPFRSIDNSEHSCVAFLVNSGVNVSWSHPSWMNGTTAIEQLVRKTSVPLRSFVRYGLLLPYDAMLAPSLNLRSLSELQSPKNSTGAVIDILATVAANEQLISGNYGTNIPLLLLFMTNTNLNISMHLADLTSTGGDSILSLHNALLQKRQNSVAGTDRWLNNRISVSQVLFEAIESGAHPLVDALLDLPVNIYPRENGLFADTNGSTAVHRLIAAHHRQLEPQTQPEPQLSSPIPSIAATCNRDVGVTCYVYSCPASFGRTECSMGSCRCQLGYCLNSLGVCERTCQDGEVVWRDECRPLNAMSTNKADQMTVYPIGTRFGNLRFGEGFMSDMALLDQESARSDRAPLYALSSQLDGAGNSPLVIALIHNNSNAVCALLGHNVPIMSEETRDQVLSLLLGESELTRAAGSEETLRAGRWGLLQALSASVPQPVSYFTAHQPIRGADLQLWNELKSLKHLHGSQWASVFCACWPSTPFVCVPVNEPQFIEWEECLLTDWRRGGTQVCEPVGSCHKYFFQEYTREVSNRRHWPSQWRYNECERLSEYRQSSTLCVSEAEINSCEKKIKAAQAKAYNDDAVRDAQKAIQNSGAYDIYSQNQQKGRTVGFGNKM